MSSHPTPPAPRAPQLALAAALLYGLVAQLLALRANLGANPLGRLPIVDAAAYWDWAGRITGGEWVGEHPFVSAPLYPYVLGIVRGLGGGLGATYALNTALWLGALLLIARCGWRLAPVIGVLAAWCFALTLDPFFEVGRVLAGSLQVLLIAAVLERAGALLQTPSRGRALQLGALVGLAALAFPPLLAALPLFAFWAWRSLNRGRGIELLAAGLLAIAPATAHNLAAGGEFIPISAHGGLTFWHGNNPSADGTYQAHAVTAEKQKQHLDALQQTRAARGPEAGWGDVSSHFFGKGLRWWGEEPGRASALAAKKLWLTVSARNYGDIYQATQERAEPYGRWLWLAPFSLATWLPVTLLGLALLLRWQPARTWPAFVLLLAGVAVCVVFWYSPRYRLPIAPVACLTTGWALREIRLLWSERRGVAFALSAAMLLGLVTGPINAALGLDAPASHRPVYEFTVGQALSSLGEPDAALVRFQRAQDAGHPQAALELANLMGGAAGSLEELARIADARPDDYYAQRSFAVALARAGRPAEAVPFFERALALDANDWQSHLGLGSARVELGDPKAALQPLAEAVRLASNEPDPRYMQCVAQLRSGNPSLARESLAKLVEAHPGHEQARALLVQLLRAAGQDGAAREYLESGLSLSPQHFGMRFVLAWLLATSTADEVRDGARAVELAEALLAELPGDPERLDVLAAALAEDGRFVEAQQRGAEALAALPVGAADGLRAALEARLVGYREGRPMRESLQ